MSAYFHHGEPVMVDSRPLAAATAGDMVLLGAKLCVYHTDVPAGELGALSYPGGQSAYLIDLAPGASFAIGDPVTVNPAIGLTGAGATFGVCIKAADQAAGDTQVYAMLDN